MSLRQSAFGFLRRLRYPHRAVTAVAWSRTTNNALIQTGNWIAVFAPVIMSIKSMFMFGHYQFAVGLGSGPNNCSAKVRSVSCSD